MTDVDDLDPFEHATATPGPCLDCQTDNQNRGKTTPTPDVPRWTIGRNAFCQTHATARTNAAKKGTA